MSCAAHDLAVSRRFLDWEDVDLIRELVASLPPGPISVVDLGAGSGTTAGAVYAERPDADVWTIDHSGEALMWASRFLENIGIDMAHWHQHEGDSVEAADLFDPGDIANGRRPVRDMLMIDSSHEYAHTVAELAAWLPIVRSGGIVWCHDYRGGYPGVTEAVDQAVARGELVPIAVRGLGWGGRKP